MAAAAGAAGKTAEEGHGGDGQEEPGAEREDGQTSEGGERVGGTAGASQTEGNGTAQSRCGEERRAGFFRKGLEIRYSTHQRGTELVFLNAQSLLCFSCLPADLELFCFGDSVFPAGKGGILKFTPKICILLKFIEPVKYRPFH